MTAVALPNRTEFPIKSALQDLISRVFSPPLVDRCLRYMLLQQPGNQVYSLDEGVRIDGTKSAALPPVIYDSFTGTSALDSHTPEIAPIGSAWSVKNGAFNVSGGVAAAVQNLYPSAVIDAGIANFEIISSIHVGTGWGMGIIVRSTADATTHHLYIITGLGDKTYRFIFTSLTGGGGVVLLPLTISTNSEWWIKVWCNVENIRFWASTDGITYTLLQDGYSFASVASRTVVGIGGFNGDASSTFKDFTVTPNGAVHYVVIGDSISSSTATWAGKLMPLRNGGRGVADIFAASGARIVYEMAGYVTSALADTNSPTMCIVALGTNDTDDANVYTTYKAQLVRLLTMFPANRIFCMGILPRTLATDNGAVNNPRIAQACSECGVTYWDTRTDPWIDATIGVDSADGLHPNVSGVTKIRDRVQALLPAA